MPPEALVPATDVGTRYAGWLLAGYWLAGAFGFGAVVVAFWRPHVRNVDRARHVAARLVREL